MPSQQVAGRRPIAPSYGRASCQVKMRYAVAGFLPLRVTAERDRVALFLAPIWVATIACPKIGQRNMARKGFHRTQRWHLNPFENRDSQEKFGRMALTRLLERRGFSARATAGPAARQALGLVSTGQSHPLCASDGGATGVACLELHVDRLSDFRKGHTLEEIFAKRLGMR